MDKNIRGKQYQQELLAATDALLEKVINVSSFPSEQLARIYHQRGNAYQSLGKEELAFEDYQQALKLFEETNYVGRGGVYFYSWNFREALAAFNQALEQNPQNGDAYDGRGWTYCKLGEYQRSLDDFEHALKLAPNDKSLASIYNGLRWAYYGLGKYQQALSANDYLLEHYSEFYSENIYVFRSQCFRSLKDYQQSIEACNHAIRLAPKSAEGYVQRGITYLWLKDLGQAQADFVRSRELEPRYYASGAGSPRIEVALLTEWVGMCQGGIDLPVSERLEVIATADLQFDTATQFEITPIMHLCLGIALLLRRNFEGAFAELEQALLTARPNRVWGAHFWKGVAYAFLGQDEEATAAIEKALVSGLPPLLLAPLRWLEQERPDFYGEYVVPLLARFG